MDLGWQATGHPICILLPRIPALVAISPVPRDQQAPFSSPATRKNPHGAPGISRAPPAHHPAPISEEPQCPVPTGQSCQPAPCCPSSDTHQTWSRPRELLVHQEIRTGTHQGFLGMMGTGQYEARSTQIPGVCCLANGTFRCFSQCLAMKSGHSPNAG